MSEKLKQDFKISQGCYLQFFTAIFLESKTFWSRPYSNNNNLSHSGTSHHFLSVCFSVDRRSYRDLYPDLRHHVRREPAVDPESGQELPLLLFRSDGHVWIYGSVWRILCGFLCCTSPVRSEKERREAEICWSHDQTSPTHLLMRSHAITDIILINFRWENL